MADSSQASTSDFQPSPARLENLRRYNIESDKLSATGLSPYLRRVMIDSAPRPRYLRDVIEPWQRPLYNMISPLIERAAGFPVIPPAGLLPNKPWGAFITLPRGHSKTSTLSQLIAWALIYSKRKISAFAAAADGDQASILLERLDREKSHNPWIKNKLRRTYYRVIGPAGYLKVLSSEAPGASGLMGDLFILDEIVWWRNKALFDILVSGWNKRPHAAFIILSNAGVLGTWQHDIWSMAKTQSQYWVTYEVPGTVASWIDKDKLAFDRKMLPPALASRLYDNVWQGEMGEYLSRAEIMPCVNQNLREAPNGSAHDYILTMDYGATKDRATAAVMHMDFVLGKVVLDRMYIHQGEPGKPTPIKLVQEWVEQAMVDFTIREAWLDPYQLEVVAQDLEGRIDVRRFNFSVSRAGEGHHAMAENLRSLFLNQKIELPPHVAALTLADGSTEDLVDELAALIVEVTSGGKRRSADGANSTEDVLYRAQHTSGRHDDRYCCAIAGTKIETDHGPVNVEDIRCGDLVLTRHGYRPVVYSACTGVKEVFTLECDDGRILTATGDHPVFSAGDFTRLDSLSEGSIIQTWKNKPKSSLTASRTGGIRTQSRSRIADIFRPIQNGKVRSGTIIETCGNLFTDSFQTDATSTTRTKTLSTILSKILSVLLLRSTLSITSRGQTRPNESSPTLTPDESISSDFMRLAVNGESLQKAWLISNVDLSKRRSDGKTRLLLSPSASFANLISRHFFRSELNIARILALKRTSTIRQSTEWRRSARFVEENLSPISIDQVDLAPLRVRRLFSSGQKLVYNLTVAEVPEYFANGILVHNCLAMGALACVRRHQRVEPLVFGVSRAAKVEPKKTGDEGYADIQYLRPWDCWAATCKAEDGKISVVRDLRNAEEAGWMVNAYARKIGVAEPNRLPAGAIDDDRIKELEAMVPQ